MRPPQRVADPATGETLDVVRAWPRKRDHVLIEFRTDHGRTVNGEWFGSREELSAAHAHTPGARSLPATDAPGGMLFHASGSDPRLPGLEPLLRRGAELVVHRPGRRAVLRERTDAGVSYHKVVRRSRLARLVAAHRRMEHVVGDAARLPRLLGVHEDAGVLTVSELPGATLHELGRRQDVKAEPLRRQWGSLGLALAHLHRAGAPGDPSAGVGARAPASHEAAAEAATVRRWLSPVTRWGLLPEVTDVELEQWLRPLTEGSPTPPVLLHRDLHDKQVIPQADGPPGLLDLDTAALGEAALDIANILVHLDLRVRQGLLTVDAARQARVAFLEGVAPDSMTLSRVPAYATAATLRLAGVYALRPAWQGVAVDLLAAVRAGRV